MAKCVEGLEPYLPLSLVTCAIIIVRSERYHILTLSKCTACRHEL